MLFLLSQCLIAAVSSDKQDWGTINTRSVLTQERWLLVFQIHLVVQVSLWLCKYLSSQMVSSLLVTTLSWCLSLTRMLAQPPDFPSNAVLAVGISRELPQSRDCTSAWQYGRATGFPGETDWKMPLGLQGIFKVLFGGEKHWKLVTLPWFGSANEHLCLGGVICRNKCFVCCIWGHSLVHRDPYGAWDCYRPLQSKR